MHLRNSYSTMDLSKSKDPTSSVVSELKAPESSHITNRYLIANILFH